jgi:cellulose synthase (UDP-forming)
MLGSEINEAKQALNRLGSWLMRLFVLSPEEARPLPAFLRRPTQIVADTLGIRHSNDPAEWLLRLFLLPSTQPENLTDTPVEESRFRLHSRNWGKFFSPVFDVAMWPLTWVMTRLDRLDYEGGGQTLEKWARQTQTSRKLTSMVMAVLVLMALYLAVTTPLSLQEQLLFFVALWVSSMLLRRIPGNLPGLLLMTLSLMATGRYAWWRLTQTFELSSPAEYVFGTGLILAEAYTWLIIVLGYIQGAWPLKRKSVPLPHDRSLWPTVDVYIPTYNEPLRVVKPTVFAALGVDWPQDKLNIYLLDDGRRSEFREFAAEAGVHYLIRPNNVHAKAGNLNHALTKTDGEFIAIFDCDHIPVRSFLTETMGWMLRDQRCAMLQTPHHFFSPDPFERNLDTFGRVPNEGSLFYGLVQDGNDLWNATFFCGSCAVIRRKPLEEVGGIAVETVTEDAHTALKMHRLGYTTAYLNKIQAAGLATESLSGHIGQRIRWARGMAQIFRTDNPMLGKGLSLFQRLCYSNAMLHFFNGLPRLVFLTAPLCYLYFEMHIINASAIVLAAYVLPHLVQANLANSRMQGRYRHSFWAEVYESVLAWYITLPTLVALINPRAGSFNVTAKGGLIKETYFDWGISLPYLVLVMLNLGGFLLGLFRLFEWNNFEQATVLMNLIWTTFNVIMLGTAISVAVESRQIRVAHRVTMDIPVKLYLPNGDIKDCRTLDYSVSGLGIALPDDLAINPGSRLNIGLQHNTGLLTFPVEAVIQNGRNLGLQFEPLTLEQEKYLVQCTFGRADAWTDWDTTEPDRPLSSLAEVLFYGIKGYVHLFRLIPEFFSRRARPLPTT